jgi:hypothetical protein
MKSRGWFDNLTIAGSGLGSLEEKTGGGSGVVKRVVGRI